MVSAMGFFGTLFGKKPVTGPFIFDLRCSFHPIRLPARKKDNIVLEVLVRNNSDQELLTSIVVIAPKELGFDQLGLQQEHESRLGFLKPGEERRVRLEVWSTQKTPPGLYPVKVFAISHYRDYAHVLNEVKKTIELRVV